MTDGVALQFASHPVDDSVLEFCRAHRGAMGAVPTTPEGCAMVARLINEYLLLAEGDISEAALETVEIELQVPALSPETVETFAKRVALGNNGGDWEEHYTPDQKEHWRAFVRDLHYAMATGGNP